MILQSKFLIFIFDLILFLIYYYFIFHLEQSSLIIVAYIIIDTWATII